MNRTKKDILSFILSIAVAIGSCVGIKHIITNNFVFLGQWWRGHVANEFVAIQANIDGIYESEYESFGKGASNHIHEWRVMARVNYLVNNSNYTANLSLESFPYYEHNQSQAFISDFKKKGNVLKVFYDPSNPAFVVLNQDEVPSFFMSMSIAVLNLIILLILLAILLICLANIYEFIIPTHNKETDKSISKKITNYFKGSHSTISQMKQDENKADDNLILTGNHLDDYYSGALEKFALQWWEGCYCYVYLFPNKVIHAVQEDKGYYTREYTLKEILDKTYVTPLMDSFFDDSEAGIAMEKAFFKAVKEVADKEAI